MKRILFAALLMPALLLPLAAEAAPKPKADCKTACKGGCEEATGKEYDVCMERCLQRCQEQEPAPTGDAPAQGEPKK